MLRKLMIWTGVALVLAGLGWADWQSGLGQPTGYLFNTPNKAVEAGYCLAVAERAREITWGQGARKLEAFLSEQIDFWRDRVDGQQVAGRAALAADVASAENEGALLHLAVQDCGNRAVSFYGHRFQSFE